MLLNAPPLDFFFLSIYTLSIDLSMLINTAQKGIAVKNTPPVVHRIPLTKARINLGQIVRRAHLNKECFILEKDGIPVAGIMDVADMEDWLELQNPKIQKQIKEGYEAYRQGKTRPARDFLAELQREKTTDKKKNSR